MTAAEIETLYRAIRESLNDWVERLRKERGSGFPEKVTAFRPDMAVHGKYRKPCPVCGSPVQRIVHAENETNYCARCQTGGKLLADRSLSRLLKQDWPRTLEELEEGLGCERSEARWIFLCGKRPAASVVGWQRRMNARSARNTSSATGITPMKSAATKCRASHG